MTTKHHIGFPSIEQFRNIISNINRQFSFVGLDAQGEPIYDNTLPKPVLTFTGTIKLHGTNAGVCYNTVKGLWSQSRENIITPVQDNAGFAFFVESNKDILLEIILASAERSNIDLNTNTISVYGEWCGGNIQKGVAITNLTKSFFIFGIKVTPFEIEGLEKQAPAYWIDYTNLRSNDCNIYNISDFKTYSVDVDFNMPQLIQNKLVDWTIEVENECPVGKAFGFSGVGEGIVWSCEYKGVVYRFKTKGEKHSASKVKTIAAVDVDKLNSIKDFVEYAVTENRFNQGLEKTFLNGEPIDVKKMGDLIRWVVNDIIKEEIDTMTASNIEPKDVNKYVSAKVRDMFFKLPV